MPSHWRLENIQQLRIESGIEDVELQKSICNLAVGDIVNLTILNSKSSHSGEPIVVEVVAIQGFNYQGKVIRASNNESLSRELADQSIAFSKKHIHSVPSQQQRINLANENN